MLARLKIIIILHKLLTINYFKTQIKNMHKPGDDAWYNISSELLIFSGITV